MMNHIEKIIEKTVQFLFVYILHRELTKNSMDGILQFVRFAIVGFSNTVISYIIYVIVLLTFQSLEILESIDYLCSQLISFILSVLWSFYWNNKYVFHDDVEERNIISALLKVYASYAFTGLFLNGILSVLWVQVFRVNKMIAPIINLLISVPVNFIMNKFWAFK